jgi:polyphosphate kinase 2 (PPK2 family)
LHREAYLEFLRQAPDFEHNLVRSGIILFKFWFSVSREEQKRRFRNRETHPLKQWKFSSIDRASTAKWAHCTEANKKMFFYTDTSKAPWLVVKSNCKKGRASIPCAMCCIEYIMMKKTFLSFEN